MALKQTVSLWNEAVLFFQLGKLEESIDQFKKISSQSAKTLYNIGCLNLFLRRYDSALISFDEALGHDRFLAVGYFQRAVTKFYLCRYADAETDFQLTRQHMRGELLINYQQLGLPFTLYLHQVVNNLAAIQLQLGNEAAMHALLREYVHLQSQNTLPMMPPSSKNNLKLVEIPQDNCLFYPSKSMVDNLEKKDFLGKAKVVSSVIEHDTFVGFEGNRKSLSVPGSPVLAHPSITRSYTPPPPSRPSRPPPRLPAQASNNMESLMSQKEGSSFKERPPPPNRKAPQLAMCSETVQRTRMEQSNLNNLNR